MGITDIIVYLWAAFTLLSFIAVTLWWALGHFLNWVVASSGLVESNKDTQAWLDANRTIPLNVFVESADGDSLESLNEGFSKRISK